MEKNAKIFPFFYKERKRTQRSEHSFEKNGCHCPTLHIRGECCCLRSQNLGFESRHTAASAASAAKAAEAAKKRKVKSKQTKKIAAFTKGSSPRMSFLNHASFLSLTMKSRATGPPVFGCNSLPVRSVYTRTVRVGSLLSQHPCHCLLPTTQILTQ